MNLIKSMNHVIITSLSEVAYAEQFEGDTSFRTAAYSNVRKDSNPIPIPIQNPILIQFQSKIQSKIRSNPCPTTQYNQSGKIYFSPCRPQQTNSSWPQIKVFHARHPSYTESPTWECDKHVISVAHFLF